MPKAALKTQTLFQIAMEEGADAWAEAIKDIAQYTQRARTLGMSGDVIVDRLLGDLDNSTGIFKTMLGKYEGAQTKLIDTVSQVDSNEGIKESAELFRWELEDLAEHCNTCLANASLEPQTWDAWEELGIPGAGNTDCGQYCKCTLVGVE